VLLKNQYPPQFSDKCINDTITKIICDKVSEKNDCDKDKDEEKFQLFIQYRGKCSERYANDLRKTGVPIRTIFTLRKLRTVMPSLKEPVDDVMKSGLVYKLNCPRCKACYVGATSRHLQVRFGEHISRKKGAVAKHLATCGSVCRIEDMEILSATWQGEVHLFTMEALWIRQLKPSINVKDEYKSRELIIKI